MVYRHKRISITLLFFMSTLMILSALYSEVLRPRTKRSSESLLLVNPIRKDIIQNIHTISYQSSQYQISLEKKQNEWHMTSPQKAKANTETIESLLDYLKNVDVQTIIDDNQINQNNFSIDNPRLNISIKSNKNEKQEILFGIKNTISSSSYLTVNHIKAIFQVSIPKTNIDNLTEQDFIDRRVFRKKEGLTKLIVEQTNPYKYLKKYDLLKKPLPKILGVKFYKVIDGQEQKYFKKAFAKKHKILSFFTSGSKQVYKVSALLNQNKKLALEANSFFAIKKAGSTKILLIRKKFYKLFN